MPLASEAVAASDTLAPETVAPSSGAVIDTVGGVVSPAGVVTVTGSDGSETFPAASKAFTV